MKDSKLYALFRQFTSPERADLSNRLHSPWYNRRSDVLKLYQALDKRVTKKIADFSKKSIFKEVFPNETYDDRKIRYTMSFLLKIIEQYLAEQVQDNVDLHQKIKLTTAYRQRNLEKHFNQSIKTARSSLEKLPRNATFYHLNYLIELEQYSYNAESKRTTANNLQSLNDAYDIQYLANKLKQSCLLLSHQAVYKVNYDSGLLTMVLDYLKDSDHLEVPAIAIYYYCYKALTEESHEDFQKLKNKFLEYQHLFPKEEMADVLLLAINFCIKQINTRQDQYLREVFELYQLGLDNKLLLLQNRLHRFVYKNVVASGLRLGEIDWVETFIQTYAPLVDANYRSEYLHYNRARLFFFKKDYAQAMSLLATVDSSDLLLTMDAKVMLLKMYYELEEFDPLDNLLASFKAFLNRKKVISYHRENYSQLIEFTKKLLYLNHNDKTAKGSLSQKIEASSVTEKEWLLKQL